MFIDLGQGAFSASGLAVLGVEHLKLACEQHGIDLAVASAIYKLSELLLVEKKMYVTPDQPATYPEILKEIYVSFQKLSKQTVSANISKLHLSVLDTSQVSA
jgi:hypothetical protein